MSERTDAQIVICGRGGQGIVFLTRLLGGAAGCEGREVITSETHGMAQRGGSIDSFVKIGDFHSPVVQPGKAHVAVVVHRDRLQEARAFLRPGGACFVNTGESLDSAICCDATTAARELGSARSANLVLLGFAARSAPHLFPGEQAIMDAVELLAPKLAAASRRALTRGGELAKGSPAS